MSEDKKPREFWLYEPEETFTETKIGDAESTHLIHVIEYSAYEILEQKLEFAEQFIKHNSGTTLDDWYKDHLEKGKEGE